MSADARPAPLALTTGEPAGIGAEIALKTWIRFGTTLHPFFLIDDSERVTALARRFDIDCPVQRITSAAEAVSAFSRALPVLSPEVPLAATVSLGAPTPATAPAVIGAIDHAVRLVSSGEAAAVVTNPIQKSVLRDAGFSFPGHTEYLGHLSGVARPVMMLLTEGLKVVPVTVHTALKNVAHQLTAPEIELCGRVTAAALKTDFGIAQPRLVVAALNPHGGEKGQMGDEEERIIAPAVARLRAAGLAVTGPAPADTLFHASARQTYDAAVCMYHDQALIPLKTLDFAGGVNMTLGLPFVRTSPDHGTACDIAAQGTADPSSLAAALKVAGEVAARRERAKAAA